uniref:Homeobox domain-containing protein n=3 Tax=Parascaris univalens TaxID=6257 RepID=A0A915BZS1_PARUN
MNVLPRTWAISHFTRPHPPEGADSQGELDESTSQGNDASTSVATFVHGETCTHELLDRVYKICEYGLSQYNPSIMYAARSNRYFGALFEILCEKKKQMSVLSDDRCGEVMQQVQLQRIDNMLEECMESTQRKNYKFGNVVREEEESVDETYQRLLSECCADFNHFRRQLRVKEAELSYEVAQILQRQQHFRPITQADIEKCRYEICMKVDGYQNQLKQLTCQKILMLRSRYLDIRKKRRNFSKDATRILTRFFHSHIEHPYPSEAEKTELARKCNLSVNQVSNWFGNKRIRFRKSHICYTDDISSTFGDDGAKKIADPATNTQNRSSLYDPECVRSDATGMPFDLWQQVAACENEANDQRSRAPNQEICANDDKAVDNEAVEQTIDKR